MKAYVEAKKIEEEEDYPSDESSSSSEVEDEEDEDEEEEGGGDDMFVVPGFLSDISDDWCPDVSEYFQRFLSWSRNRLSTAPGPI